jgi:quinol-cytochrome oxidoreductase complex cytochrome b subunit
MTIAYAGMHDTVMLFNYDQKLTLQYETIWEEISNLKTSGEISYFLIFNLPSWMIYWLYEVLHTFFVVTAQFVAFFAMAFWLFLFLYSFFFYEKVENYFKDKRDFRKKFFNVIFNLKNI